MSLQLTPKQNEFILKANHRYNFKVGAVRSGKSYGDMAYVIPARIRERAGLDGLNFIIGVSKQTIERNVLRPMREIYTEALVGNINNNTNIAKICGEPVFCIGAEKASQVSKIQGSSVKYAYGDEIAKWSKDVFEMLKSRLDKDYSCMDGSLNPEGPNHWLKAFIDNPDFDVYTQHYKIFDNPFLPKKFVENLCKEYEGAFYKRYIEGEWAQAEGLIFPHYLDAISDCPYILSVETFTEMSDFCLSIDYGTLNAFAALLWVKIGPTWWAWRGYYYSGRETGIQKTDSEYADAVCKLVEPLFQVQQEKAKKVYGFEPDRLTAIIDPSAASFITELKKRKIFRTLHADNNVEDGIRNTNTAILHDIIKIDRNIKEWESEAAGYVWDKVKGTDEYKEVPLKVNDHYMDATRYFVRTKKLGRIKLIEDGQYEKLLYSEGSMGANALLGYF